MFNASKGKMHASSCDVYQSLCHLSMVWGMNLTWETTPSHVALLHHARGIHNNIMYYHVALPCT